MSGTEQREPIVRKKLQAVGGGRGAGAQALAPVQTHLRVAL